ncbi:hypothetical protein HYU93_04285 [Candidatus Daviesbacteria bacterium]|nr:hypothetical protein [Candidatus Daviesbacteria bacterium]
MKKYNKNKIILIGILLVLSPVSFYLGFSYYKWTTPNLYKQPQILWDQKIENPKTKGWHIYLNPRFNFAFKYPKDSTFQEGYSPIDDTYQYGWIKFIPPGGSQTDNQLYNIEISINVNKLDQDVNVKDYVKKSGLKPYIEFLPDQNYHDILVDGRSAVAVDYEVTDEIIRKQKSYFQTKGSPLPKGYKSKLVFIKNKNLIYTITSGSLLYKEDEDQFGVLVSTFKFVN